MTTIERMMTEFTPLPLDVIQYCVQPYLTRPAQYHNTFAHVIDSINRLGEYHEFLLGMDIDDAPDEWIQQTWWREIWTRERQNDYALKIELRVFRQIEY